MQSLLRGERTSHQRHWIAHRFCPFLDLCTHNPVEVKELISQSRGQQGEPEWFLPVAAALLKHCCPQCGCQPCSQNLWRGGIAVTSMKWTCFCDHSLRTGPRFLPGVPLKNFMMCYAKILCTGLTSGRILPSPLQTEMGFSHRLSLHPAERSASSWAKKTRAQPDELSQHRLTACASWICAEIQALSLIPQCLSSADCPSKLIRKIINLHPLCLNMSNWLSEQEWIWHQP